jgi:release factor glutamine methyltransferase
LLKKTQDSPNQQEQILIFVKKLSEGMPFAYAVEEAEFYGMPFQVTPDVLIPRPETEGLVEIALSFFSQQKKPLHGCELGIGSGVISITLLRYLSDLRMSASDCMQKALFLAQKNAQAILKDPQRLELVLVSPQQTLEWTQNQTFDFLISNPPYLRGSFECDPGVFQWEPAVALFAPEKDPLYFYEKIFEYSHCLSSSGMVFLELNPACAEKTAQIFETAFDCEIKKDLNFHDRYLVGRKKV